MNGTHGETADRGVVQREPHVDQAIDFEIRPFQLALKREPPAQRLPSCLRSRYRPNDDNRNSKNGLHFKILPLWKQM